MAQFAAPHKDQRPVLRHLGRAIATGEALRVRGPNSAGKTTLLRMLVGLLRARVQHLPPPERPRQRLDHGVVGTRARRTLGFVRPHY